MGVLFCFCFFPEGISTGAISFETLGCVLPFQVGLQQNSYVLYYNSLSSNTCVSMGLVQQQHRVFPIELVEF